ncbi:MAG: ATP-binding protein, partial [Candidatus Aenigmarchaeota archaeon]|nr:ATP-binding protein [Candidatus Aenigmarchaeota archaeon]
YGRRTGQIKLNMFKFMDYKKFFPCNKTEDIVKYFSITDGLPFYINFIDKTKTAEENIIQNISSPQSILYEEGEILVKEELGDVPTYFSILDAIASGKNKLGEIANFTGMNSHSLTGYIKKLLLIGLIKKEAPIIEKITSKKGIYLLSDNFLDFWFKFIYPSKSSINEKEELRKKLHKNYNSYLGFVFEQIAKEFLILKQPFEFVKIGRQWSRIPKVKQSYEIDLVALNEDNREIGFFECKWSNLKTGESFGILNKLKQKSKFVDWNLDNRKEHFGLIAKKIQNKDELKKQGFFAWDLDDFKERFK